MRKGFSVTLAMVAFAMLVQSASALAPVISEIPDIIVGDAENSSAANVFVFPDAIDLNAKVSDDLTSAAGIIWTYAHSGGSVVYMINKAAPSNPATDNLVSPIASRRVDNQSDPVDTNGPRTATIRDNLRSPFGTGAGLGPYPSGSNGVTDSGPATIIDSKVLTLFASDGSTVSLDNAKSFIVYTQDNGYDAISSRDEIVWQGDFTTGAQGFTYTQASGVAPGTQTTNGLCINVGLTGSNDGSWFSPYATVQLVANSVWEARMSVTTTQTIAFFTPLWMLVYDNYGSATVGQNEYGGEYFFLDNEGGANSPIAGIGRTGENNFKVFMMPVQMQTPQFSSSTTGFFQSGIDANNDMRVILRVFDIGTSYGAQFDQGSVCWRNMTIVKHDLADMVVEQDNVMNVTTFTNAMQGALSASSFYYDVTGQGATLTFGATGTTIAPNPDWNTGTNLMFRPGDQTVNLSGAGDTTSNADNWPVRWVADSTYYIEFQCSAINSSTESTPPDVIRVGADTLSSELTFDNFCVPNTPDLSAGFNTRGLSMPRTGTPQKYACFFYTHSVTKTGIVDGTRWRPRFDVLTANTLSPMGRTTNPTGLIVNSMVIKKVSFN